MDYEAIETIGNIQAIGDRLFNEARRNVSGPQIASVDAAPAVGFPVCPVGMHEDQFADMLAMEEEMTLAGDPHEHINFLQITH